MKKTITLFLLFTICALTLTSCFASIGSSDPQVFKKEGMELTLTKEFRESEYEGYTAVYDSRNVAVFALKESFSLLEGLEDYSLEDYAALVMQNNNQASSAAPSSNNGLTWFEYDFFNEEEDVTYHYFTYMYKASDAFWIVQFAANVEKLDTYGDKIVEWAKSVKFE